MQGKISINSFLVDGFNKEFDALIPIILVI